VGTTLQSLSSDAALVLVDVQQGFSSAIWGPRNNPHLEMNISKLLDGWRVADMPVFHVRHFSVISGSPLEEKSSGSRIMPFVTPRDGEPVITKHVNSAFIGTNLEAQLRKRNIHQLVVAGLTTDHCVSSTIRMAANLGFVVYCAGDATATFDRIGPDGRHFGAEDMHAMSLASLHGEFATVTNTIDILGVVSQRVLERI
jgi:nicotinamidase-related amidase